MLECVDAAPGGGFLAHFGYQNPNPDPVVVPFENTFVPDPANRGQPTVFEPGRVKDVFQAASTGSALTWRLTGNRVTASRDSKPSCRGSITIVKVLHPSNDPGRFHLEIDGVTAGGATAVGDGGTTGTVAVNPGARTVGESAAQGTSLADYVVQIVCVSGGEVVAEAASATVSVPVQRDEHVLCTITNTRKSGLKPLVPVLECVVFRGATPEQAVWGYRNDNDFAVQVPIGTANEFAPAPADRGQPKLFEPGRWTGTFQTPFGNAATLAWTLAGQSATASSASTRCTAILMLRKVTAPAGDPGVFNLLLNGQVLASGGNGTTAGPYTVGVGEGTVSETAGPGTNLADYESTVACTRNGIQEVSVTGTKVDGAVANGDFVVCTFTNRRITTPPTPLPPDPPQPPRPPTQPDPPPLTPTPPPGELVDLAVVKTARPTTALLGQRITWTIKVTNASPVAAADVNVVKVSERPYRTTLVSVRSSQGTCSRTSCDLGRLAPGASATITAVTRATQIGEILNVVRVGVRGTGVELSQQHRLQPRSRRRPLQATAATGRLPHPRSRAQAIAGRHDIDRAHHCPKPVRDTCGRGEGARAWTRGERAGNDELARDRSLHRHAQRVRLRDLPRLGAVTCGGRAGLRDLPRVAFSRRSPRIGYRLSSYGSRSIGVPSGASLARARSTAFETLTQPCETA